MCISSGTGFPSACLWLARATTTAAGRKGNVSLMLITKPVFECFAALADTEWSACCCSVAFDGE